MIKRLFGNNMFGQTLLWGLIWGFTEALPGTVLHTLPIENLSGWILYPFGFFCMFRLFNLTGNLYSPLGCGITATLVKLSVLLFYQPVLLIFVLKPALFILLESVFTTLVLFAGSRKTVHHFLTGVDNVFPAS